MKGEGLPSYGVSEALHLRGNMLEVPQSLARLLHVCVLHGGNDP